MAYVAITAAQVDTNSPLDETLMGQIKDNFIDHEARIVTLETPYTVQSSGNQVISASSTWTPVAGIYQIVCTVSVVRFELYISAGWHTNQDDVGGGVIFCDGTNMRLAEQVGSPGTVYYQKF